MRTYIKKTLRPKEHVLYETGLHWIIVTPGLLWLFGAWIFTAFAKTYFNSALLSIKLVHHYYLYEVIAAFMFLVGLLATISALLAMHCAEYGLTNERIIMKTGWLRQDALDILLDKVESLKIIQGFLGRLLGYGSIIIYGIGSTQDAFYQVKNPFEFRNRVQLEIEKYLERQAS